MHRRSQCIPPVNVDLRWQWYFGENETDNLSIAAFYKDMDKPIERVVQPASGPSSTPSTIPPTPREIRRGRDFPESSSATPSG